MKREDELKSICLDVLSRDGIQDGFSVTMAEDITAKIMAAGYVRFDTVVLDPQKCVQLLATILNGFRAEHPLVIMEVDEDTQKDSTIDGEVSPEVV